jgi:hypothetical protein
VWAGTSETMSENTSFLFLNFCRHFVTKSEKLTNTWVLFGFDFFLTCYVSEFRETWTYSVREVHLPFVCSSI